MTERREEARYGPEGADWHQEPFTLLDGLYDPTDGLPEAVSAVVQALLDAPRGWTVQITVRGA